MTMVGVTDEGIERIPILAAAVVYRFCSGQRDISISILLHVMFWKIRMDTVLRVEITKSIVQLDKHLNFKLKYNPGP